VTEPNVFDYQYTCTLNSIPCQESFRGGSGEGGWYTDEDIELLMTVDFNRDGNVEEADWTILFERLAEH
jgi:hypothetical protein